MRVLLKVIQGPHAGREFGLDRHETFFVGRGKNAHFRLGSKDQFFSRLHFLIELNPPRCRITDLNSTNGTFVNGAQVVSAELKSGDLIEGGDTIIRVDFLDDLPDAGTSQASGGESRVAAPKADGTLPAPFAALLFESMDIPGARSGANDPGQSTREKLPALPKLKPASDSDAIPVLQPVPDSKPARAPASTTAKNCPGCGEPPKTRLKGLVCDECEALTVDLDQTVPGYRLLRKLGEGGMGIVWLGVSEADGEPRAIKVIKGRGGVGEREAGRFLREAETLQALSHPNIVSFRESGDVCGTLYFAMEYVRGRDATTISRATAGGVPPRRVLMWACGLLDALDYAHAMGYVHRDIKPQNLLIGEGKAGEPDVVKLADFGLARAYCNSPISGLTFTGDIAGTLFYMAPEQMLNLRATKPAADIYSTGALLVHLLTGKRHYEFPENIVGQTRALLEQEPIPLAKLRPSLPARLCAVVDRSLSREPAERFESAEAMKHALEEFLRAPKSKK
jgi:eukaryotic-like serine/threonine-protein kinase